MYVCIFIFSIATEFFGDPGCCIIFDCILKLEIWIGGHHSIQIWKHVSMDFSLQKDIIMIPAFIEHCSNLTSGFLRPQFFILLKNLWSKCCGIFFWNPESATCIFFSIFTNELFHKSISKFSWVILGWKWTIIFTMFVMDGLWRTEEQG